MKRRLLFSALAGLMLLSSAPQAQALTKDDIINMSNIGVADNVIVSAIQASDTVFVLTPDDIIELTRKGVSQTVIEAMQKTRKAPPAEAPAPAPAVPDRNAAESAPARPAAQEPARAPASAPARRSSPDEDRANNSRPASPAQARPLPADVKQLKRKYETGKYASAAASAFELLTGPNKDRYADSRSTIYYYLGKSLYKLGYYHSAHDIFLTVARDGASGPHFIGCLAQLTHTSARLQEYNQFAELLKDTSTKDLPRRVRSTLLYLIGLARYEHEDFEEARRALEGVSQSSELYARAQFLEAMSMYRQGDSRQAVRTFRSLVESQLVGDPDEIKDVVDLSLLNMARIYYRVEDFKRAEQLYELVPRDSHYWGQSLFEGAYTNFWQGDYNVTLGQILTLESPFFEGRVFLPEAPILKALTYYNLCEYDRVQTILKDYQVYYKPLRDRLRGFVKGHDGVLKGTLEQFHSDNAAMKQAIDAYSTLYEAADRKADASLPAEVLAEVEEQRDFKNLHYHLGMMRKEADDIKGGKWRGTAFGNTLIQKIEQDEVKVRADAGRFLLEQLNRIEKELSTLLGQTDIILFEVVNAQKEEFEDKFRNPEHVETYEKLEQSYATEATYIFWPFTGEFWKDELGYYRFTERGSCRSKQ